MAGFFARFGKRFASNGTITNPTDAEAATGWAHLSNGKPTVERFNAAFQWADEKDNWLYGQVAGVLRRVGMTPAEAGDDQLANALRAMSLRPWFFASAAGPGSYVVPSGVAAVLVLVVGGGGASYGCDNNQVRCGAGGGGGGASLGTPSVTAGQSVAYTVGAGGASAGAGVPAGSGGTSSFGSFVSATGGGGGNQLAGGFGGSGSGGIVNLQGTPGGDGNSLSPAAPTGYGGAAALLGGGGRAASPLVATSVASTPGSGAPAPYNTNAAYAPGLSGRPGCVLVVPLG